MAPVSGSVVRRGPVAARRQHHGTRRLLSRDTTPAVRAAHLVVRASQTALVIIAVHARVRLVVGAIFMVRGPLLDGPRPGRADEASRRGAVLLNPVGISLDRHFWHISSEHILFNTAPSIRSVSKVAFTARLMITLAVARHAPRVRRVGARAINLMAVREFTRSTPLMVRATRLFVVALETGLVLGAVAPVGLRRRAAGWVLLVDAATRPMSHTPGAGWADHPSRRNIREVALAIREVKNCRCGKLIFRNSRRCKKRNKKELSHL